MILPSIDLVYYSLSFFISTFTGVIVFVVLSSIYSNCPSVDSSESTLVQQESYQEALRMLEDARKKSLQILYDSQIKAQKSLGDVKNLSQDAKTDLYHLISKIYEKHEKEMDRLGSELSGDFKKALEEEKRKGVDMISEISKELRTQVVSEVEDLKESLTSQVHTSEAEFKRVLTEKYTQVDAEIATHKQSKIEELNKTLTQVVARICANVLRRELTTTEYESLILEQFDEFLLRKGEK